MIYSLGRSRHSRVGAYKRSITKSVLSIVKRIQRRSVQRNPSHSCRQDAANICSRCAQRIRKGKVFGTWFGWHQLSCLTDHARRWSDWQDENREYYLRHTTRDHAGQRGTSKSRHTHRCFAITEQWYQGNMFLRYHYDNQIPSREKIVRS